MATARITLQGLMRWDPTIFDDAKIPNTMNRQTLIDTIVLRCADYEILYPDWEFFKAASDLFFRRHELTFTRWWDAMLQDYEPLYNYDRFEEYNDGTKEKIDSTAKTSGTTETAVSAYDSSSYQNRDKSTDSSNSSSGSNTDREHTARNHIFGNIGVTTSSAMLREYLEMQETSIYDKIADLYLIELCIPVE